MLTEKPRPYGLALEIVEYDRNITIIVVNKSNDPQEYIRRLENAPNVERINIRPATEEEWLNQWKIEQAFIQAFASFDKPLDKSLENLSF